MKKERALKDSLKVKDVGEVDRKITELEMHMQRNVNDLKEEKDILRKIQALKVTRRKFIEMKAAAGNTATTSQGESLPVLKEKLKTEKSGADSFRKAIEVLDKQLDALKAQNSEAETNSTKLKESYTKVSEKMKKIFEEKREVIKKWSADNDAYYEQMRNVRKQRDEERKLQEEEYEKKREEEERLQEEEEMKKKPWEEEIALCDFLVQYLEGLQGKNKIVREPVVESKAPPVAPAKKDSSLEGLTAVGKKTAEEENFLMMGGGKKKSNNKNKTKKDTSGRLTHSLDLLGSFSLLGLAAPVKLDEVPASIIELQEKKAYYDVLPRGPKKSAASKNEESDSKPAKSNKKKTGGKAPSVDNSELFPTLPGSKSPAVPAVGAGWSN